MSDAYKNMEDCRDKALSPATIFFQLSQNIGMILHFFETILKDIFDLKRSVISFIILIISVVTVSAQIVTTDPDLPIDTKPVTVYFNASLGTKGLMDYTGDVYAHTGVITDKSTGSSDWKYVKAAWDVNLPECKMTRVETNLYKLDITPSIREFYGVPNGEKILKMAFVFRNADGSKEGKDDGAKDIFADVYEEGLNVSFTHPSGNWVLTDSTETLSLTASATDTSALTLYINNISVKQTYGTSITYDYSFPNAGDYTSVVTAEKNGKTVADTLFICAQKDPDTLSIPEGNSDGINYNSSSEVTFVLYAPYKKNVFLLGDFNNWYPQNAWQLKKDGNRWWITVSGLTPGKEYAFQYLVDSTIRIADPYSEKILDPSNDKYIPTTVYPNLKPYPDGKTDGIVGVIAPGKEKFQWDDTGFVPAKTKDLVIYELLIRDFVTSHDIKDVAGKLDYLHTLGVNAIELMPFSEFEGNSSWGYNPDFYFAPDKYYGRDIDYKAFIDECHKRGIAVIMDMVLNHAYNQCPLVQLYYNPIANQPAADNPWFNQTSPNPVFYWGNDFNHESPATKYFVSRVIKYWMKDYHIDGYRFDFTKGFTNTPGDGSAYDPSRIAILENMYDTLKTADTNGIMICEHFTANSEEKELSDYGMCIWGNLNYNYGQASMGYLNNSDFSWGSYEARGWSKPHLVTYMESHDEERLMYNNLTNGNQLADYSIKDTATALQRIALCGDLFFTIPGPKMIWMFEELGYDYSINRCEDGSLSSDCRVSPKPVVWNYYNDPKRKELYLDFAKLIEVKKNYPAFETTDYTLHVGDNIAVKKITLKDPEQDVVAMGNFGLTETSTEAGFTKTGMWYELFSGDSINVSDTSMNINLQAGEYKLYSTEKMLTPTGTREVISNNIAFTLFPNPVKNQLSVTTDAVISAFEIYDLSGIKQMTIKNPEKPYSINVSKLSGGFYLLVGKTQDGKNIILKFVK